MPPCLGPIDDGAFVPTLSARIRDGTEDKGAFLRPRVCSRPQEAPARKGVRVRIPRDAPSSPVPPRVSFLPSVLIDTPTSVGSLVSLTCRSSFVFPVAASNRGAVLWNGEGWATAF